MNGLGSRTAISSGCVGVGLRPAHYSHVLETLPPMPWVEVVSENFLGLDGSGGGPGQLLDRVRSHYAVGLHGTGLSIGSTDPLDWDYLRQLKNLINRVQPEWVTDHLCWTSVGGEHLHDLLPLPYDESALRHVVQRVEQVQEYLGRPIGLENVSSYVSYRTSNLGEAEFLGEIARRSGCGILLDINNIFVSCTNHSWDAQSYLSQIDPSRVWYTHLAGHSEGKHGLVDTHDAPVPDSVWDLYRQFLSQAGPVPALVEWDDKIPPFETLWAQVVQAQEIQEQVCGTRVAKTNPRSVSPAINGG